MRLQMPEPVPPQPDPIPVEDPPPGDEPPLEFPPPGDEPTQPPVPVRLANARENLLLIPGLVRGGPRTRALRLYYPPSGNRIATDSP